MGDGHFLNDSKFLELICWPGMMKGRNFSGMGMKGEGTKLTANMIFFYNKIVTFLHL